MERTFKVTINAKRGARISGSEIESAVFGTRVCPGDFYSVAVEEVVGAAKTEVVGALYALGRKSGSVWKLIDFFNSKSSAEAALGKKTSAFLSRFVKGEFAILTFSPAVGVWRVVGKSVKV